MKHNTEKFREAIQRASSIVSGDESLQVSAVLTFKDGKVWAYNDFLLIGVPLETDMAGSIGAKRMNDFLKKVTQPEIEFAAVGDAAEIKLKSGRATLALQDVTVPIDVAPRPDAWHVLPTDVVAAMSLATHFTAPMKADPLLGCVSIEDSFVEATNKNVLMKSSLSIALGFSALIPASAVKTVAQFQPTSYAHDDGWVHFKCEDGAELSARVVEGAYPTQAIGRLLEMETRDTLEFPDELSGVLARAAACLQLTDMATVAIENGRLTVSVRELSVADFEESLPMESATDLKFSIKPRVFADLLNECRVLELCDIGTAPQGAAAHMLRYASDDVKIILALSNPAE